MKNVHLPKISIFLHDEKCPLAKNKHFLHDEKCPLAKNKHLFVISEKGGNWHIDDTFELISIHAR